MAAIICNSAIIIIHWAEKDLNSFPLGELEETTRMPSYEDYPTKPEIQ